jgi:hypothetical protein
MLTMTRPARDAKLLIDVADVVVRGTVRDGERRCDLLFGCAPADQSQHLHLAVSQNGRPLAPDRAAPCLTRGFEGGIDGRGQAFAPIVHAPVSEALPVVGRAVAAGRPLVQRPWAVPFVLKWEPLFGVATGCGRWLDRPDSGALPWQQKLTQRRPRRLLDKTAPGGRSCASLHHNLRAFPGHPLKPTSGHAR